MSEYPDTFDVKDPRLEKLFKDCGEEIKSYSQKDPTGNRNASERLSHILNEVVKTNPNGDYEIVGMNVVLLKRPVMAYGGESPRGIRAFCSILEEISISIGNYSRVPSERLDQLKKFCLKGAESARNFHKRF